MTEGQKGQQYGDCTSQFERSKEVTVLVVYKDSRCNCEHGDCQPLRGLKIR